MELTLEQRERIRKNRERALRLQQERKRKLQTTKTETQKTKETENNTREKRTKRESEVGVDIGEGAANTERDKEEEDCEEWEEGASEWVSKGEAVAKYCLPAGTLAVCEVTEKENPRHSSWTPMKLFRRSELRRRAYKRYGGKEGLIAERDKREQKRLEKDLKAAEDIFK